jgi:hypothetical protein
MYPPLSHRSLTSARHNSNEVRRGIDRDRHIHAGFAVSSPENSTQTQTQTSTTNDSSNSLGVQEPYVRQTDEARLGGYSAYNPQHSAGTPSHNHDESNKNNDNLNNNNNSTRQSSLPEAVQTSQVRIPADVTHTHNTKQSSLPEAVHASQPTEAAHIQAPSTPTKQLPDNLQASPSPRKLASPGTLTLRPLASRFNPVIVTSLGSALAGSQPTTPGVLTPRGGGVVSGQMNTLGMLSSYPPTPRGGAPSTRIANDDSRSPIPHSAGNWRENDGHAGDLGTPPGGKQSIPVGIGLMLMQMAGNSGGFEVYVDFVQSTSAKMQVCYYVHTHEYIYMDLI